jgi:hypothetical protein
LLDDDDSAIFPLRPKFTSGVATDDFLEAANGALKVYGEH